MSLFTSLFQRLSSEKAAPSSYPGTWVSVSAGDSGVNQNNLLEANREWVYIAVDKNARSLSSVRFKVMRYTKNGDDQEVFSGPMVQFLEKPAPNFTGKDFIYLSTAYKELAGNAFWERKGKAVIGPLLPNRVTPILSGGTLTGFKVSGDGGQRELQLTDVLHDRHIDPARPYWGVGKLQKIGRWADTSGYVAEFLSKFFVNGATFGGFIETEEETESRINLIKLGLKNDHIGVANAHKIGVLPSREAYRQSGVVKTMRWYTAEDEKVCAFCGPEDGRVIDVNGVFYAKGAVLEAEGQKLELGYRTIDVPPLHPQCRCFVRPEHIDIN